MRRRLLPVPAVVAVLTILVAAVVAGCGGDGDEVGSGGTASGAAPMARSLGLSYMKNGELEEAARQFGKYIEAAPDRPFGHANLGLVRLWQGRTGEALRRVRRAVELAPDDPGVRLNLAAVLAATGRTDSARAVLRGTLEEREGHLKSLYALAELADEDAGGNAREERAEWLRRIVERSPANLAARTELALAEAGRGNAGEAAEQLASLRRQAPELPAEVSERLDRAIRRLEDGAGREALPAVSSFAERFRVTTTYQSAASALRGPRPDMPGAVAVSFARAGTSGREEGPALRLRPAEVLPEQGGSGSVRALAAADADADGDPDLVVGGPQHPLRLLVNDGGRFRERTAAAGIAGGDSGGPAGVTAARFGDVDNDGWLDLYVAREGPNRLYLNRGDGTFREVADSAGVSETGVGGASDVLLVDLDHDGDLDLFLVGPGGQRAYRNRGDGTFRERTRAFGFRRGEPGSGAALLDLGLDVDADLAVARAGGAPLLYENRRGGRFREVSEDRGLASVGPAGDVEVGDVDGDGDFDLVFGPAGGRPARVVENREEGFAAGVGSSAALEPTASEGPAPVRLADLDNDGDLDLLVGAGGSGDPGLRAFENDGAGGLSPAPAWTEGLEGRAHALETLDHDGDADLDLAAGGPTGARVLRNDGGSSNHQVTVRLTGLRTGGGKNNHFGLGARVELRAGDRYQVRMVTDPGGAHFGLGERPRAEVVRVQWPNGVPQTQYYASGETGVSEGQTLKGSCAFLYTWDGEEFTFVTDVLWRSAIGMPVGIMGGSGDRGRSYAPPEPSKEFRRIPGEALAPKDGRYLLQLTEELWETAYLDEVRLVAVDHPDSVRVFLDERFVPPGPVRDRVHRVTDLRPPAGARDGEGRDLLPRLRADDDVYAAPFEPGPHQGIVTPHSIVLDVGDVAAEDRPVLLLTGWVYPTDASINVAMAQNPELESRPPVLQVPADGGGVGDGGSRAPEWRTVSEVGFPAGKDKTLVVDLTEALRAGTDSVRIRTNMQVYWDRVAVASRVPRAEVRRTPLRADSADLHFRGYSREYRKGGRHGPFWFDYDDVSTVSRWRPTSGHYTRYGDVRELLDASDDMYVIMAQGDELSLAFDAGAVPELPEGWSRDFTLYTEGWLKDADLNTATGATVGPLPYHGMPRYPYGPEAEGYPDDSTHRAYRERYNTRVREPGLAPLGADSTPPRGVSPRGRP